MAKILVVDDEKDTLTAIEAVLSSEGRRAPKSMHKPCFSVRSIARQEPVHLALAEM